MSRCSWRSAEALQKLHREQRDIDRKEERTRFRRLKAIREWENTGEPPFRSKEYTYPSAGGVKGVGSFLRAADLALHLHDRGHTLTGDMSVALDSLERRKSALSEACLNFVDEHAPHKHPERTDRNWEVGRVELQLFVEAAERMTPAERKAFTQALAPNRDKSGGYIGPLEPFAARLLRAKNATVDQAISKQFFGSSSGNGCTSGGVGRFARSVKATVSPSVSKRHPSSCLYGKVN